MTDYDILNESRLGSFLAVPEFPSLLTFVTRVPVEMSGSDHSLARIGNNLQNWVQRKVWLGTLKNGNLVIEKRKSCCHSPTQPRVCFLGVSRHPLWHKIIGTNRKSLFRILCTYSHKKKSSMQNKLGTQNFAIFGLTRNQKNHLIFAGWNLACSPSFRFYNYPWKITIMITKKASQLTKPNYPNLLSQKYVFI